MYNSLGKKIVLMKMQMQKMIWIQLMLMKMQNMRLSLKSSVRPLALLIDLSINLGSCICVFDRDRYLRTVLPTVEGLIRLIRWTIRPLSKPYGNPDKTL